MEELSSSIPEELSKVLLRADTAERVLLACQQVERALHEQALFWEWIDKLTAPEGSPCAKASSDSAKWRAEGNAQFKEGRFAEAVQCYTRALQYAFGKEVAVLYANRAACLEKMGKTEEVTEECSQAIEADPSCSKAWYRRGKAYGVLGQHSAAINDLEHALSLSDSQQIKAELDILKQALNIERPNHNQPVYTETHSQPFHTKAKQESFDTKKLNQAPPNGPPLKNPHPRHPFPFLSFKIKVQTIPSMGRGITTAHEVYPGEVLLSEPPYSFLLSKPLRLTLCHYCSLALPLNPTPCLGCSYPLYCSPACRSLAQIAHSHECGGATWHAVLPRDAVLAARVIAANLGLGLRTLDVGVRGKGLDLGARDKSLDPRARVKSLDLRARDEARDLGPRDEGLDLGTMRGLDLGPRQEGLDRGAAEGGLDMGVTSGVLDPEGLDLGPRQESLDLEAGGLDLGPRSRGLGSRLDLGAMHGSPEMGKGEERVRLVVTCCIVAECLRKGKLIEVDAAQVFEVAVKIRVNVMAVTRMERRSVGGFEEMQKVSVGQALYPGGLRLNHSCLPNCHVPFSGSALHVRAVRALKAGEQMLISYGPEKGFMSRAKRQQALLEKYNFECKCLACEGDQTGDICLTGYRCSDSRCLGVVPSEEARKVIFGIFNQRIG